MPTNTQKATVKLLKEANYKKLNQAAITRLINRLTKEEDAATMSEIAKNIIGFEMYNKPKLKTEKEALASVIKRLKKPSRDALRTGLGVPNPSGVNNDLNKRRKQMEEGISYGYLVGIEDLYKYDLFHLFNQISRDADEGKVDSRTEAIVKNIAERKEEITEEVERFPAYSITDPYIKANYPVQYVKIYGPPVSLSTSSDPSVAVGDPSGGPVAETDKPLPSGGARPRPLGSFTGKSQTLGGSSDPLGGTVRPDPIGGSSDPLGGTVRPDPTPKGGKGGPKGSKTSGGVADPPQKPSGGSRSSGGSRPSTDPTPSKGNQPRFTLEDLQRFARGAQETKRQYDTGELFTWAMNMEFPELSALQEAVNQTPLGFTQADIDTLDRMMSEDLNVRSDVKTSDALKIVAKLMVNPDKIGYLAKTRANQWGNRQINNMKKFFRGISNTFNKAKVAADTVEAIEQTRLGLKPKPYSDEEKESLKLRGELGGTPYVEWAQPTQPAIGLKPARDYAKINTPLDERGLQLVEQFKSLNHSILRGLLEWVKTQPVRDPDSPDHVTWTREDANRLYDIGEQIGSLTDEDTYGALVSLTNEMIANTPKSYFDLSKSEWEDVINKLRQQGGAWVTEGISDDSKWTRPNNMKLTAPSYPEPTPPSGTETQTQKPPKKDEDDPDPDPEPPEEEDPPPLDPLREAEQKMSIRHVSMAGRSQLRPKLEIGDTEGLLRPTPAEEKTSETVWNQYDIVPEGYGEGTRYENPLFNAQIQSDNLRYSRTYPMPNMRRPSTGQVPQAFLNRAFPWVNNVYQANLPEGMPDYHEVNGFGSYPIDAEAVGAQTWRPSFNQDRFVYPAKQVELQSCQNDLASGALNPPFKDVRIPVTRYTPSYKQVHHVPPFQENTLLPTDGKAPISLDVEAVTGVKGRSLRWKRRL